MIEVLTLGVVYIVGGSLVLVGIEFAELFIRWRARRSA